MDSELQETPRAAAAYEAYCSLHPSSRSLSRLVEVFYSESDAVKSSPGAHQKFTDSKIRQLKKWSSAYRWQERVKAYDRDYEEEYRRREEAERETKRRQRESAIEEMNDRHVALAMEHQQKIVDHIGYLISTGSFGSIASVQLLKLAMDAERLARGEATERTEQQQSGQISVVLTPGTAQQMVVETPDELAEYRKRRGLPPPASEEHLG